MSASSVFSMTDFEEQRICTKFCFVSKYSATETSEMLVKAFGDKAISQENVDMLFIGFKKDRERIREEQGLGPESTSSCKCEFYYKMPPEKNSMAVMNNAIT